MNFFENIKSIVEEYKDYKNPKGLKALTTQNSKNRNIFKYIQAKSLGKKYGDALYKHFKVKKNIDNYDLLINLFGKKNIERALSNQGLTTVQIADKLFEKENEETFKGMQGNYMLQNMMNCIAFNKATGLNLSQTWYGIHPETFHRKSLDDRSMLDIFEENEVTKDVLKEIYDMYGENIITCYNTYH